jgi:hypothetical protein
MKQQAAYPQDVGLRDVTTRSFELMRVEGSMEGQPSNEPLKDNTVLRQAQHGRKIFNDCNTRPVRLERVEG